MEARFTVRTYKIIPPPEYRGEDVRRVRELLEMSQAAFAGFLGADPSTVRSWEQGLRTPSPLACRMLSEIEADPIHWRKRLIACLAGPETQGPTAEPASAERPEAPARGLRSPTHRLRDDTDVWLTEAVAGREMGGQWLVCVNRPHPGCGPQA